MSKRKSEEPLDIVASISPASKRARVEVDIDDSIEHTSQNGTTNKVNGHKEPADRRSVPDDDFDEDDEDEVAPLRQSAPTQGFSDLYLDTINRTILDFDFEKLCSVTLSNINVYACLVCGKYFQGRGSKSHAYFHALDEDHHVYINMETKNVYVLPEGYEVLNKSLEDIKYVVDPRFTEEDIKKLDKVPTESFDLSNKRYRPGFIGMNNIKANDYLNVAVQTLSHVAPLRNFFLLNTGPYTSSKQHQTQKTSSSNNTADINTSQIPVRFSTLARKLYSTRAFRSHVSPHELLQAIALHSSKKFTLTSQSDPVDFLSWFLNTVHLSLGGSRTRPQSSIIQRTFQGRLRIESQAITARSDTQGDRLRFEDSSTIKTNITNFLMLTLDLPPVPLFRDSVESKNIIPQIPLTTLLNKYNGIQASEKLAQRIRHRLLHPLPPYLIFHIKRFSTNKFVSERNPTIVTFPSPRNLDMAPYVQPDPSHADVGEPIYYDMVANIVLDATVGTGKGGEDSNAADAASRAVGGDGERVSWKVQLRDKAVAYVVAKGGKTDLPEWREIQDLFVERAEAETLFTKESYLMVWERRTRPKSKS